MHMKKALLPLAAAAAVAFVTIAAPAPADAKGGRKTAATLGLLGGLALGVGAVTGGLVGAPVYGQPVYGQPVYHRRRCHTMMVQHGYNQWGRPIMVRERVCN